MAAALVLLATGGASAPGTAQAFALGSLPISFERNVGQAPAPTAFLARGAGYGVWADRHGFEVVAGDPVGGDPARLRVEIPGGAARLEPRRQLAGRANYLIGSKPEQWQTGVASFARVAYRDAFPGIDLVLRGDGRHLRYDLVVGPGADPDRISLPMTKAGRPRITFDGDLEFKAGELRQLRPFAFQRIGGQRREIPSRFTLRGRRLGFELGAYDRERRLVIDPVVEYSTFLGGTSYDQADAVHVDSDGAAYVAGLTYSADFPVSAGESGSGPSFCAPADNPGFVPPPESSCRSDGFVTKLDPDGTGIEYSTFIGGGRSDRVKAITVDSSGAAHIAGGTSSSNFPLTRGAPDRQAAGERLALGVGLVIPAEAFVAKLAPDGSSLEFSTLLGGSDAEEARGIAINRRDGSVVVGGHTFSHDFPTTRGAFDRRLNASGRPGTECGDIFAARITGDGRRLRYSTLVGGTRLEFALGLDLDRRGNAHLVGESTSLDAPTTPDAIQPRGSFGADGPTDCVDPFQQFEQADPLIVTLSPNGRKLEYGSYFGGSRHEHATALDVRGGDLYLVGHTNSDDFPTTRGAFDRTVTPVGPGSFQFDGFAAKLTGGRILEYSTVLGGGANEWAVDVAAAADGSAYVTGFTNSTDYPTSDDALDETYVGPEDPFSDAFVTRIDPLGSALIYSSYFGANGPDSGSSIAVDGQARAYLVGSTYSPDLTTTADAPQPIFAGPITYSDAFVTRFSALGPDRVSGVPRREPMRLSAEFDRRRSGRDVYRFRVRTSRGAPVGRAAVRFAGQRVLADFSGRARIRVRAGAGPRRVVASAPGFERAVARVEAP